MTACYRFDPEKSRFTVQAFAGGLLSVFAHNPTIAIRDFTGTIRFNPETLADVSLEMVIRANSLEVAGDVNPRDRPEIERTMQSEVLESAAYPEIRFRSTATTADRIAANWYRLRVKGELSLRGVTRPHEVDVQLRIGESEVRLSGAFTLLQSVFGIKRVSGVGGTITLKDELKFAFDILGGKVE
jgi:polyisoprenoid-binding protein YceI